MEAGRVRGVVDRVFPLARTAEAVRHLLDGRVRGRVAVGVTGEDGEDLADRGNRAGER